MLLALRKIEELLAREIKSLRKKIQHSTSWANNTFWSKVLLSSSFHKGQNRLHRFSSKSLQRYFLSGYALNAGGGWTGDTLVADAEACFRSLRQKISKKKKCEFEKCENISFFHVLTVQ